MALTTIGTQKRATPRLSILRGWDINNPTNIAPRGASAEDQGTILSGHVVSKDANDKWVLGGAGARGTATIGFAIQDDTDFDVVGSGVITAISVLGKYELQTAFFKSTDEYVNGTPVTYDGTTGKIKATTLDSGSAILGYCSGPPVDVLQGATRTDDIYQNPSNAFASNVTGTSNYVLQIVTQYAPNSTDAVSGATGPSGATGATGPRGQTGVTGATGV